MLTLGTLKSSSLSLAWAKTGMRRRQNNSLFMMERETTKDLETTETVSAVVDVSSFRCERRMSVPPPQYLPS